MEPGDTTDVPLDLGAAIEMIGRLRAEVKRRPRLTIISVKQPAQLHHADTLHMVEPGQRVTVTLETDHHAFHFTAVANGAGHMIDLTTRG